MAQDTGSDLPSLSAPHNGSAGLGVDNTTEMGMLLDSVEACRQLLTEIRDIAVSIKIPAFLRAHK